MTYYNPNPYGMNPQSTQRVGNYQTPQMNYQTPQMNYQTPQMNYQTPQMNYQTPQMNYQNLAPAQQGILSGRVITHESEVTPNEIPMDGTVSLFPTNDYSCIFAKTWGTDGTIKTYKYIPSQTNPVDTSKTSYTTEEIMKKLESIEVMLNKHISIDNSSDGDDTNVKHAATLNGTVEEQSKSCK